MRASRWDFKPAGRVKASWVGSVQALHWAAHHRHASFGFGWRGAGRALMLGPERW
jgi:hypothetical protein